eukprot:5633119-Prymnesium_polylepis.1
MGDMLPVAGHSLVRERLPPSTLAHTEAPNHCEGVAYRCRPVAICLQVTPQSHAPPLRGL